jgi:6-phosphogluconolactonase (cycloisomerase 2 family)
VYTQTNDAAGNAVMVFQSSNGVLNPVGAFPTGGLGTSAGLGSQGAIAMTPGGRWLLAVNAGSNSITTMHVTSSGLSFGSTTASGGVMPISLTVFGRTVYVLNAGGDNNITGFRLEASGTLTPIPNSTKSLSGPAVGGAEVAFSPDGEFLVVTEKGTNLIDAFPVDSNGVAGSLVTTASQGLTPFGFAFDRSGRVYVSEAVGGATDASTASSYALGAGGALQVISPSVPTNQTAACWLVVSKGGRFAYTTNTGSRTVSLFSIANDGLLTLLSSVAGSTPIGGAIDAAFSSDGRYLHVLTSGGASIVSFQLKPDGSLVEVGTVTAPPTAVGLAAE